MSKVFISYRRDDSGVTADRIYDSLVSYFGRHFIFEDVSTIPYGARFPQFIDEMLRQASVALVVIGPRWLDITTADGKRRLDDPNDWVRIEVETALRHNLTIIPVLVEGAHMPHANQLPESLRPLAQLNALPVRRAPDYQIDMARLTQEVERHIVGSSLSSPVAAQYIPKGADNEQRVEWVVIAFAVATFAIIAAAGIFYLVTH
jgi:hypothetical protein